jgi:integrase
MLPSSAKLQYFICPFFVPEFKNSTLWLNFFERQKMKGSPAHQVAIIYNQSGINQIGESRYQAKEAIREELRQEGIPCTSENINARLGVYSEATQRQYRNEWKEFLSHARENSGEKSIDNLTAEHAHAYLEDKIKDGLTRGTLDKYCAGLQKLETALNKHFVEKGWNKEADFNLKDIKEDIKNIDPKELTSRAFQNPQEVINNLQNETFKLAATLQLQSGMRIHEVNHLREKNLQGFKKDPVTGQEKGFLSVQGKGGKIREVMVSKETYSKLEKAIQNNENKRFEFNKDTYNRHLKEAGIKAGDRQETSHALRHNFAQNRVSECCQNGKSFGEAKQIVSIQLGHNRAEITEIYLR